MDQKFKLSEVRVLVDTLRLILFIAILCNALSFVVFAASHSCISNIFHRTAIDDLVWFKLNKWLRYSIKLVLYQKVRPNLNSPLITLVSTLWLVSKSRILIPITAFIKGCMARFRSSKENVRTPVRARDDWVASWRSFAEYFLWCERVFDAWKLTNTKDHTFAYYSKSERVGSPAELIVNSVIISEYQFKVHLK